MQLVRADMSVKAESGGMFNSYKVTYSPDTHRLLKVLMDEARMTMGQRQEVRSCLKRGEPLPALVRKPRRPSYVDENLFDMKRNYYFLRRGKEQIIDSGAYDRDRYRFVGETVDLEKEKKKLQNMMAYGKNPKKSEEAKRKDRRGRENPGRKVVTAEERVEELVIEIEERMEFVEEMKDLGKRKDYDVIIEQEIAGKVREMKKLNKKLGEKYEKEIELWKKRRVK